MALIVVDANRVFSALLTKGSVFDVFVLNSVLNKFDFIAPEFLFFEIKNNFDEIVSRSRLTQEQISEVFIFVKQQVKTLPFDVFNQFASEAEKIAPHTKDVQYFSLALASNASIWSEEKAFRNQSRIKIVSTNELRLRLFSPFLF